MDRRGFLKAAVITPVAAPVAMREAAASAGINPLIGVFSEGSFGDDVDCESDFGPALKNDYILDRIKTTFSKKYQDKERDRLKNMAVNRLDPDLASSRSFSLSTAIRIQRERNVQRHIDYQMNNALDQYLEFFKKPFDMSTLKDLIGE